MFSIQTDQFVSKTEVGVAKRIGNKISDISDVPFLGEGSAMSFFMRVVMWSSGGASLSEITKLVHMYTMFPIRSESFDRACDFSWGVDVILAKGDKAANGRVIGIEYADSVAFGVGLFKVVEEERIEGEGGEEG